MGIFEVGLNAFLHYDMVKNPFGRQGIECGNLNVINLQKLIGVALLGGMALLEWVWPCWRKCITLEVGFEGSYTQAMLSVNIVHFLLSLDQDGELSAPSLVQCLSVCHLL